MRKYATPSSDSFKVAKTIDEDNPMSLKTMIKQNLVLVVGLTLPLLLGDVSIHR